MKNDLTIVLFFMVFTVVILINPVFAYNEKEQQCIDDIPDDATDLERRAAIKECTKYKIDYNFI